MASSNGCLERVSAAINSSLSGAFSRLGRAVGARPWLTIALCVLVAMGFGAGLADFTQEDDPARAFVPSGTRALIDQDDVQNTFGSQTRFSSFVITTGDGNLGNMLTKTNLLAAFDFLDGLNSFTVNAANASGVARDWALNDLCVRVPVFFPLPGTRCLLSSVFAAWNYDRSALVAEADDASARATLALQLSQDELKQFIGGLEETGAGVPTAGKALRATLILQNNDFDDTPDDNSGRTNDPVAEAWEEKAVEFSLEYGPVDVAPSTTFSFGEEIGGAIGGDVIFQSLSYIIIIAYVIAAVQNRCHFVYGSTTIALTGILTIGLSIVSSFGFCQLIGKKYGNTHSVLPFIILGVGADGIFIVLNAYRRTAFSDPLPQRMAEALEHSGVSLTVSSMTNVIAFAIGSATVIPDLSSFCVYASMCFFFLWIYLATFFAACLVLNERRMDQHRLDVFCCARDCRGARTDPKRVTEFTPSRLSRFMEHTYAPFIMRKGVQLFIVVCTVGWVSYSIFNITKLSVEATGSNFIPDDSYLKDNFELQARFFGGEPTPVSVISKQFDYFEQRAAVLAMPGLFRFPSTFSTQAPYIIPSFEAWVEQFALAMNGSVAVGFAIDTLTEVLPDSTMDNQPWPTSSALFYNYLRLWLDDSAGARFAGLILFTSAAREEIVRARVQMQHAPIGGFEDGLFKDDPDEIVAAVNKMYDIVDGLPFPALAYGFEYTDDWASYAIIERELIQNVSLALASVFVVTLLLIGNPVTSSLVFLCVLITIVELLGVQDLLGLAIDTVAVVLFVLAVGLAVDYSAHVGYHFMTEHGTREERVAATCGNVAVPVLNGAMSTFLAVLLQSASQSYVFRVVFFDFFFAILFASLNGLVLLPILLSRFGPQPYANTAAVHAKSPA